MITFILGMMVGGIIAVVFLCLCQASGASSRRDELMRGEENRYGN